MPNVAASVRQRLLNLSRSQQRPFAEVLQFYVMERFLYRLSQSPWADRFVLKGALMLQVWQSPESRPTMDIDMLGRIQNDPDTVLDRIRNVFTVDVEEDGLVFDPDTLRSERITQDAEYEGIRIRGQITLDRARARLQIDIGFGDVVVPEPQSMPYPVLLDFPAPKLLCYSRESAIAEKFEAMVALGEINSRMKDFYDIWLLSRQFSFNGNDIKKALEATFAQRDTAWPTTTIFSESFASDKQSQWTAFLVRLGDAPSEPDFETILKTLEAFIGKIIVAGNDQLTTWIWPAGGPWQVNA